MARNQENTSFKCSNCGNIVPPVTNGSYRNHCPFCLYSLHLDINPGDRLSNCHGLMKPIGLTYSGNKGWQIQHLCLSCGVKKVCKVATDTVESDSYEMIARINGGG